MTDTPQQPPPQSITPGRAELDLSVQLAKAQNDYNRLLQNQVKILRDAGEGFSQVKDRLEKAGVEAHRTDRAMEAFHRSMADLMKMKPTELMRNWESVLGSFAKASLPAVSIGLLVETFKVLDSVGAAANKTLSNMSIQMGQMGQGRGLFGTQIGVGGLLGRAGPESGDVRGAVGTATLQLIRFGFTAEQANQAMSTMATQLPNNVIAAAAPAFAKVAGALSTQLGVGLDTAIEFMTSAFRRGATSGEALRGIFDSLRTTAVATNMSLDMTMKSFNDIWSSTRQFGGTTASTNELIRQYGDSLRTGILTNQEVAQLFSSKREMPIQQIAGLSEMMKGMKGQERFFGTGTSTEDRIGFFLKNMREGNINPRQLEAAQIQTEQRVAGNLKEGTNKEFALDIVRQQFGPVIGMATGREEQERRTAAAGIRGGYLGGPIPGLERGATLTDRTKVSTEQANRVVETSFDEYVKAATRTALTTDTLTASMGRLWEQLKVAGGFAGQGRLDVAAQALKDTGLKEAAVQSFPVAMKSALGPIGQGITLSVNFAIHQATDPNTITSQVMRNLQEELRKLKLAVQR